MDMRLNGFSREEKTFAFDGLGDIRRIKLNLKCWKWGHLYARK